MGEAAFERAVSDVSAALAKLGRGWAAPPPTRAEIQVHGVGGTAGAGSGADANHAAAPAAGGAPDGGGAVHADGGRSSVGCYF